MAMTENGMRGRRAGAPWLRAAALFLALLAGGALLAPAPAQAVLPDEILSDPALEARARNLSRELRCMVCQNQSIDDSDAPLARDLRILVRERLQAGDTDSQVLDYLVARYGEFVLLKPRLSTHTALLWLVPPAALLGGALVLILLVRRQRRTPPEAPEEQQPLTQSERARLDRLLRK